MSHAVVTGRVRRLRYQGNGYWSIFEVEVQGGEIVVAKGTLAGVYEGDCVTIHGSYRTSAKWGREFSVDRVERDERDGIAMVLGLLPELGPKRSAALREMCGQADVFAVIEEEPHRLREIPGLTDDRIAEIRRTLIERRSERELLVWCGDNGVSAYHAGLVKQKFGTRALSVLRETPYEAVKADGVGFLTADRIARRVGADAQGLARAKAAVLFVLAEAEASDGSTVVEADMMLACLRGRERGPGGRKTAIALSPRVDDEVTYAAMAELRAEREIHVGGSGSVLVQRAVTRAVEKLAAELLARFALRAPTKAPQNPDARATREPDDDMEMGWVP